MLVLAVALGAGTVAADPPAQLEADDAIAQLDEAQEAADSLNETEDQENEIVYQFENGDELVDVRYEQKYSICDSQSNQHTPAFLGV
jgi:hypothetical protein